MPLFSPEKEKKMERRSHLFLVARPGVGKEKPGRLIVTDSFPLLLNFTSTSNPFDNFLIKKVDIIMVEHIVSNIKEFCSVRSCLCRTYL